ncbi:hypothetical protein [Flindersiella endophytica]
MTDTKRISGYYESDRLEIRERLDRFRAEDVRDDQYASAAELVREVVRMLTRKQRVVEGEDPEEVYRPLRQYDQATPDDLTAEDFAAALKLIPILQDDLESDERRLIEAARDSGMSWGQLAAALGRSSRQAMFQRYKRLGGRRTWTDDTKTSQATLSTDEDHTSG